MPVTNKLGNTFLTRYWFVVTLVSEQTRINECFGFRICFGFRLGTRTGCHHSLMPHLLEFSVKWHHA